MSVWESNVGIKKYQCLLNVLIYFLIYLTTPLITIFEIGGEVPPGAQTLKLGNAGCLCLSHNHRPSPSSRGSALPKAHSCS